MAKKRIDRKVDVESGNVSFTELESGASLTCDVRGLFGDTYDAMTEVQRRLVCHAINAKVGDSAADPAQPAIPQMEATWATLLDGKWSSRGDGTGSGGKRITDLVTAVHTVLTKDGQEVTEEQVAEAVANWDEAKEKRVRNDPRVVAVMADLRLARQKERAKAKAKAAKEAEAAPLTL